MDTNNNATDPNNSDRPSSNNNNNNFTSGFNSPFNFLGLSPPDGRQNVNVIEFGVGPNGTPPTQELNRFIYNILNAVGATGAINAEFAPIRHKHASTEYIKSLKPLKLNQLQPDDFCSICFDPFKEYLTPAEIEELNKNPKDKSEVLQKEESPEAKKLKEASTVLDGHDVDNDPEIGFPTNATATETFNYGINSELDLPQDAKGETKKDNIEPDAHYAVELPQCKHHFGYSCIKEWLESNTTCPICRSETEQAQTTRSSDTNNDENPESDNTNLFNRASATIYYPLGQILMPVDWVTPVRDGIRVDDPPVSFPEDSSTASNPLSSRTWTSFRFGNADTTQGDQASPDDTNNRPLLHRVIFRTSSPRRANSNANIRTQRTHPYTRPTANPATGDSSETSTSSNTSQGDSTAPDSNNNGNGNDNDQVQQEEAADYD